MRMEFMIKLSISIRNKRQRLKTKFSMWSILVCMCHILSLILPKFSALGPQYAIRVRVMYAKGMRASVLSDNTISSIFSSVS